MNKIILVALALLTLNITSACFRNIEIDENTLCYEFDERQCSGDEWSEENPKNGSQSERESKMKEFLESKNIDVSEVKLVKDFHEAVCEACIVCPNGDRFFVKFNIDNKDKFDALELLNAAEVPCKDHF